jgi:predicted Zn-dependent protease
MIPRSLRTIFQTNQKFQEALTIDASYYEAENNLALEYFSAGKPDLAIQTLTSLAQHNPQRVLAYDNLAIILLRLHRFGEAAAAASRAVEMHPSSYKANYVYGCALITQGKWTPGAKQSLKYASERHPEAIGLLANWPNTAHQ